MIKRDDCLINLIVMVLIFLPVCVQGVCGGSVADSAASGTIQFTLVDLPENTDVYRVSLKKTGSYYKDGRVSQLQNISFIRSSNGIIWNPCNDNSCSYASFPTSGGNSGPDELILEITLINSAIDVGSCHGDTTCERLKGAISSKSGILDGIFKTGRAYEISVASLQPGIGQQYRVSERI